MEYDSRVETSILLLHDQLHQLPDVGYEQEYTRIVEQIEAKSKARVSLQSLLKSTSATSYSHMELGQLKREFKNAGCVFPRASDFSFEEFVIEFERLLRSHQVENDMIIPLFSSCLDRVKCGAHCNIIDKMLNSKKDISWSEVRAVLFSNFCKEPLQFRMMDKLRLLSWENSGATTMAQYIQIWTYTAETAKLDLTASWCYVFVRSLQNAHQGEICKLLHGRQSPIDFQSISWSAITELALNHESMHLQSCRCASTRYTNPPMVSTFRRNDRPLPSSCSSSSSSSSSSRAPTGASVATPASSSRSKPVVPAATVAAAAVSSDLTSQGQPKKAFIALRSHQDKVDSQNAWPAITCNACRKTGHVSRNCPAARRQ
jgi:hypothetical protein